MSEPTENFRAPHEEWLHRGQTFEAEGRLNEALAAYDRAIATLRLTGDAAQPATRHALGLAWVNRGNALQKVGTAPSLTEAVSAYDAAIALFHTLPLERDPRLRHQLGAAWLNRGHTLLLTSDGAAVASFENAIAELQQLPLEADPHFRLNLSGAHTNLAHVLVNVAPDRAAAAARSALALLVDFERAHEAFAGMSLRARRALVMALGPQLAAAENARQPTAELAAEATDAIDDGLILAAELERHGIAEFRPLAARLFRMGLQLYGTNQPHFLGEFVTEALATPAFAADGECRAAAEAALTQALNRTQRPGVFVAGTADADKRLATTRSLRTALQLLATLPVPPPVSPV